MGVVDEGQRRPQQFGALLCALLLVHFCIHLVMKGIEGGHVWVMESFIAGMVLLHLLVVAVSCASPRLPSLSVACFALAMVADAAFFAGISFHENAAMVTAFSAPSNVTQAEIGLGPVGRAACQCAVGSPFYSGHELDWLLSYQILLMVPAKHSLLAAPLSVGVYFGITAIFAWTINPLDVVGMLISLGFSIGAKCLLEQTQLRVVCLVEDLEQRVADEQRMRVELEMAARQMGSELDLGVPEEADISHETSLSFSLSVNTSSDQCMQRHHPGSSGDAFQEQLQARGPERRPSADAGVQTSAELARAGGGRVQDASVQTTIVWREQSFQCTCCSRPPRPPTSQDESPRPLGRSPPRGRRNRSSPASAASVRAGSPTPSSSSSEASSRSGSDDESHAKRNAAPSPLRFPQLTGTPTKQKLSMLLGCGLQWNVKVRQSMCCLYHSVVQDLLLTAARLQQQKCEAEPFTQVTQCLKCGVCAEPNLNSASLELCTWCNSQFMSSVHPVRAKRGSGPSGDGTANTLSL